MSDSTANQNSLTATLGSNADVFSCCGFAAGGALEFDGQATIDDIRVTGNDTSVTSPAGAALANGMIASFFPSPPTSLVEHSVISGNTVEATSKSGSATILGVGVLNAAGLDLESDQITDNRGDAHAPAGNAHGAGVWNGPFPGGPPVQLSIGHTPIGHNVLHGTKGIALQGAGVYSCGAPFTLDHSDVRDNHPDQIFTCPGPALLPATPALGGGAGHRSSDDLALVEGWK